MRERRLSPTMRQTRVAGDKAFVDYSGKRVPIVDPLTGEVRMAERRRRCAPSPPTRSIWVRRLASSVCCTAAGSPSRTTRTCIFSLPGGGIAPDGGSWIPCRPGFVLPVPVLSCMFRGLFLRALEKAFAAGELNFFSAHRHLHGPAAFRRYLAPAWKVNCEPEANAQGGDAIFPKRLIISNGWRSIRLSIAANRYPQEFPHSQNDLRLVIDIDIVRNSRQ